MLLRSELCNFNLLLTQGLNICMLAFCNIPGLRNYNCSCTIMKIYLKKLNLTTLEERRVRGDMIETYKIISGKENINSDKFFQLRPDREGPRARDKKNFEKMLRKK